MPISVNTTANFALYPTGSASNWGHIGGTQEMTETFIVERIGGGSMVGVNNSDINLLITEGHIPQIGELYGSWYGTPPSLFHAYCRLAEVIIQTGAKNTALLTLKWSTMYLQPPMASPDGTEAILPASMEFTTNIRKTEVFRYKGMAAPPANLNESAADIGGTPVTTGGPSGIMMDVYQVAFRIRITVDASITTPSWSMSSALATARQGISSRNSVDFLGFPIGTVDCTGVSAQMLSAEFYEIVYDFLWDEYAFHNQIPKVDIDGDPIRTTSDYTEVLWKRTARIGADFNLLWPVNAQRDFALKGWWP
jgi:hypothetical protein